MYGSRIMIPEPPVRQCWLESTRGDHSMIALVHGKLARWWSRYHLVLAY